MKELKNNVSDNTKDHNMITKNIKRHKVKQKSKLKWSNKLLAIFIMMIMVIVSLPKMAYAQLFSGDEQKVSGVSNASVKLPNTEYTESTIDLRVKVLGGEVKLNRTWINGRWYINPAWANLRFVLDPLDSSVKVIDRAGTMYQRTGDENLYTYEQVSIKKTDTGWRWFDQQGNWVNFDKQGRVLEYGDANNIKVSFLLDNDGRRIAIKDHFDELVYSFTYDSQERLTKVADREDRTVDYEWSGDQLVKVTDVMGNSWLYGYDANGQLNQKTEPDGGVIKIDYTLSTPAPKTAMTSGKDGGIVSQSAVVTTGSANRDTKLAQVGKITDKTGAVTIYNSQYGRVTKQYTITVDDPLGIKTVLVFDANGKRLSTTVNDELKETIQRDTVNKQLKIVDERGLSTTLQQDNEGRLSKIIRPDGASESYQYNTNGLITDYTNAQGTLTKLQYSSQNNLTQSIEAFGKAGERTVNWGYDKYGQAVSVTAGENQQVKLYQTYDKYGNVSSFTDGNGNIYQFTYNIQGQVTSVKNPLNNTWQLAYNAAGIPVQSLDPQGHAVKYATDALGRIIKITDPMGNDTQYDYQFSADGWKIKETDALNQTYTYTYDLSGKATSIVFPSGLDIKQGYDAQGRTLNQKDYAGNITSVEYGKKGSGLDGLIIKALYPTFSESYNYNALGLPTTISQILDNNSSLTTRVSYNELGLPTSVTYPDNSTFLTQYDAFGNVIKSIDALGNEITQKWDALGNITNVIDANGNSYSLSYDNNGNLIKETKAIGNEVEYTYDVVGQLITEKNANGTLINYKYDLAGNLIEESYVVKDQTTPSQTITYTYNNASQLTEVNQVGDTKTKFTYLLDRLGRRVKETITYYTNTNQITKVLQYSYDADGNLATITYPDNTVIKYSYEKGQLKEALLPNGEKVKWSNYHWNEPTTITFPDIDKTITYDALQKPLTIRVTDANNNILLNRSYSYDKVGNIVQSNTEEGIIDYRYDLLDRLTVATPSKLLQQKGLPIESYSYDAIANRIGSSHQPGDWQYDAKNQLTQWGEENSITVLSYTATGNVAKEIVNGKERTYIYNTADRLVSIKENNIEIASYQYDSFGRRISKTVNGETTYFIYTDEGLLAELDGTGNTKVAYGWKPDTEWGTSPLWQANLAANQTLQTVVYDYLITDYLGTPQLAVNSRGQQTWKGVSEAFGKTQLEPTNKITMNLRFPGQYFDQETSLHYNGFRHYNPMLGRYIQADPVGLRGGINLYGYAYGNPLLYLDPYGLYSFDDFVNSSAGFGDDLTFGLTKWIRDYFNIGSIDDCSNEYAVGGWASMAIPSPSTAANWIFKGGKVFKKATKINKVKTIKQRAAELEKRNGDNRVSIQTPNGRWNIDLTGNMHFDKGAGKHIDTPHVHEWKNNIIPSGPRAGQVGSKSEVGTRDATHADLRIVDKILKKRNK